MSHAGSSMMYEFTGGLTSVDVCRFPGFSLRRREWCLLNSFCCDTR